MVNVCSLIYWIKSQTVNPFIRLEFIIHYMHLVHVAYM